MDLSLSPEQEALRSALREWVEEVVVPRAIANDRAERFPAEALEGLRDGGWLGLTIPTEYDGGGADPLSYALVIEELGRGDANVRSIVSVHLGLVAGAIARHGTEEQRRAWLPRMATGEVLGCFGLTEPDAGSDPASLRSRAERLPGGGYRLTGRKIFITNATIAGVALIMARTGGAGPRGVSAFLVPTDAPGFSTVQLHGKLGLRSCDTGELVLDGVEVDPAALLGEEGRGIGLALAALDDGRISLAASCTGIAQRALEEMTAYAVQRSQFGRPIAGHQLVQELIADAALVWTVPGCSPGRRSMQRRGARRTRWPPRRRSSSPPRRRCGPRTPVSRCTAATAMSMTSSPASCSATRGSARCTKAPARSRSC